ncbi:MAG: hypothetical protein MJ127_00270 [Mogibacterium sp.]|nr:hypothetical protein [Mogibacterium sp.]
MKRKVSSRELVFMAICATLGLVCKRFIAPLTNILTDFIRLPGGSATSAFSILFIVIGVSVTDWRIAGSILCLIQAIVALGVGMSGNQGLFALVSFTVPGMVIDILRLLIRDRDSFYTIVSCTLANIASAIASNCVVFGFEGSMLVLWILVAAGFGIIAGMIGNVIIRRMNHLPDFVQLKYKVNK